MGSGSGKGTSRSSSSSSANTAVTTDNRVYQSDFGAVTAGTDVAKVALTGMVDVSQSAIDLGRSGLDAGTENLNRGLDFAENAYTSSLNFGRDINADSLGMVGRLVDQLFSFTTDTIDTVGRNATNLTDQSIGGFKQLAVASAESGDDKIVRIGGYAFAAVAAILVLPSLLKRG